MFDAGRTGHPENADFPHPHHLPHEASGSWDIDEQVYIRPLRESRRAKGTDGIHGKRWHSQDRVNGSPRAGTERLRGSSSRFGTSGAENEGTVVYIVVTVSRHLVTRWQRENAGFCTGNPSSSSTATVVARNAGASPHLLPPPPGLPGATEGTQARAWHSLRVTHDALVRTRMRKLVLQATGYGCVSSHPATRSMRSAFLPETDSPLPLRKSWSANKSVPSISVRCALIRLQREASTGALP